MDIIRLIMNGFPKISTGNMADAGCGTVKIMDNSIKPLHHTMRVVGVAYTVDTPPTANLSLHEAVTLAPPGSVLVVNAHGNMTAGHFGDLMALSCQVRGIAGLVIDGAIRDVEDIIQMSFPVFARGAIPHGNAAQTGILNKPIQCGGVQVKPGDIIFGDATGVLVISAEQIVSIYEKAAFIANSELGFVQQVNEGKTLLQIPKFLELHKIDPGVLKQDSIDLEPK